MKKSLPTALKICAQCGLEKPLSAFALRSGLLGTTYGSVCATCRQEDTRREAGGAKIRSAERVKSESDKRALRKHKEELDKKKQEKGTKAWLEHVLKQENQTRDTKKRQAAEKEKIKPNEKPAEAAKTEQERRWEEQREVRIAGTINLGEAKYSQSPIFKTLEQRLGKKIGKAPSDQPLTDAVKRTWGPKKG
ncbi:MAG: hypothetical protein EPO11_07405 [Gammaproteobacteria bacterium]|nr:MAG: hypothetical protein EPO11_07405 [Gammaproteobacteria bacterium]